MSKKFSLRIKLLISIVIVFYVSFLYAHNSSTFQLKQIQANCFPPNAGEDHYYCETPGTIFLTASLLSDGQVGTWSQINGLPTTIAQPSRSSTVVSGLQNDGGPYIYVWDISSPDCESSDTVKMYQRPTWAFQNLLDEPCTATHNAAEDLILNTSPVPFEAIDEFTITLTFLAVPPGFENIPVYPQITGSTPGDTSTASTILDLFNDGSTTDVAQLGVPLSYVVSAKLINEQASSSVLAFEEFSFALLFDKYQARGKYKYSVSISNVCGSNSFERFYTNSGFTSLTPNAGPDLYLNCNETSVDLNGTGLYYPSLADASRFHAGVWYTISSPAADPLNESNRYNPNPSLTNLVAGVYTFRYMGQFGSECQLAYDDVNVQVNNSAPTVSAVLNQTAVCGTGVAQLIAQKGNSTGLGTWTQLSPVVTTEQVIFGTTTDTVYLQDLKSFTNYTIQYSNSNDCGAASATVSFRTGKFRGPSLANIEKEYACINIDSFNLEADTVRFGYGNWELVSSPTAASPVFSAPTSNKTTINGLTEDGVYVIRFFTFTVPCNIPSEDYITLVRGAAPLLNAGSDLLDCQATFPKTLNMAATGATNSQTYWSFVSGPSVPYIFDNSARNTAITFSLPGNYVFDWVSTYANCSQEADRVEVVLAENATAALAGPDQELCGGDGSFTLDAVDLAIGETGIWTVVSTTGNLSASFADRTNPNTTVVLNNSGEAVLRWSTYGINNTCHSSDDVSLKWVELAAAPSDLNLCGANSVELIGNSFLGLDSVTVAWTLLSGPNPILETPDQSSTIVKKMKAGTYVFNYSVVSGSCSSNDSVTVTIIAPEIALAGSNQEVCGNNTITLSGNSSATATSTWYLLEGVGSGTFGTVNAPNTTFGPVQIGEEYVFAYSLDNGDCISYDYIKVEVKKEMFLDLNVNYACGNTTGTITSTVTSPGYTGNYTYLWSTGATTKDIKFSTENEVLFRLNVTAPSFCPVEEEKNIETFCLPITLSYFKGEEENCRIRIFWETLEEINVASFEVEKSIDGLNYRTVGTLEARGGEQAQQYKLYDPNAQNINYYRLKIIHKDQTTEYHDFQISIATACYKSQSVGLVDLYPNPVSVNEIHLKHFTQTDEEVIVTLFDVTGRKISNNIFQSSAGGSILSIDIKDIPAGVFFVKLNGDKPLKFIKVN